MVQSLCYLLVQYFEDKLGKISKIQKKIKQRRGSFIWCVCKVFQKTNILPSPSTFILGNAENAFLFLKYDLLQIG